MSGGNKKKCKKSRWRGFLTRWRGFLIRDFFIENKTFVIFIQPIRILTKRQHTYQFIPTHAIVNYTDHLGNVRLSYAKDPQTGNLKILDESHYYPFGLKHQEYVNFGFVNNPIQGVIIAPIANNPYKYKYNGKEWQDELGLGMYDMDMRQYDPAIARWVVMDPVIHHSVSPYSAFDNNPVFWADPSGADSEFFSAFPDQNIAHYGTSNTIDIANIIEANQKMENTMQMIKALIKLAEDYGGKNSKSGGEPNNGEPFTGEENRKRRENPSQNGKEKKGFLQLKSSNSKGAEATVTMNYKINYDDKGNPTYKVLDIKTNMEIKNSPIEKWEDGINDNHPFPTQYTVNNEGKVVFEARGQLTIGAIKFGGISWTPFQYNYRFLGEFNIPKGTGSAVLHKIK